MIENYNSPLKLKLLLKANMTCPRCPPAAQFTFGAAPPELRAQSPRCLNIGSVLELYLQTCTDRAVDT